MTTLRICCSYCSTDVPAVAVTAHGYPVCAHHLAEYTAREDPMTWFEQAACRGMDPALFFPGLGESTAEAKEACRGCPVTAECLAYALTLREADRAVTGVWGGRSERERRLLKKGNPKYALPWYERNPELAAVAQAMLDAGAGTLAIAAEVGVGKQAILNWRTRTRLATPCDSEAVA